jgi:hypothetical protein
MTIMKPRLFPFVLLALATSLLPGRLQAAAPDVTASSAGNIGCYSAIPAGTVNANGIETTSYIEFGTDTSYGRRLTTFQSPLSSSSATTVRILATGLTPGTTYHYRVVATNSDGTSTSSDQTFTTDIASSVRTWSSATSGTWTTSGRWSPSGVPIGTNDLLFSASGAYTVTVSPDSPSPTGRSLRVTNGTPTITWSATLSPTMTAPSSVENANVLVNGSSNPSFRGLAILNGSVTYTNSSSGSGLSGVYIGTNGIFTVSSNRTFNTAGTLVDNGGSVVVRGTMSSSSSAHHVLSGGKLTGNGTVNGRDMINEGTVSPDSAAGGTAILQVGVGSNAQFVQKSSGELQLDLGGTVQGTDYDALKGGGFSGVILAGKLTLRFVNGFTPANSDEFVILDNFGFVSNTFTTVTGLPDGFGVVYTENNASGKPSVKVKAVASPEIAVEQPSGTGLTDGTASLDFGTATAGHSGTTRTFTIRNSGSTDLTLGSFTVDGTNPGDFTVSTNGMATTVATGSSTTFTVTFNPAAAGARSATLHLANNDLNEASFDIMLTGTATANAVPVAGADTLSRWNTAQAAKILKSTLLTNDTDADLDTLSITGVGSALPTGATVVLAGNFIVYTAPATNSGGGSFTYTLSDGITTSTGTVTVSEISPPTQDYTANSAAISPSGADFVVTFIGVPGYGYRVQYTTDLSPPYTWNDFSPAADHTAPDSGVFTHTDVAPGSPGRFYRAILTP